MTTPLRRGLLLCEVNHQQSLDVYTGKYYYLLNGAAHGGTNSEDAKMNYEKACKIIGCGTANLERAKAVAAFTLRTATASCPLRVKAAAQLILEM